MHYRNLNKFSPKMDGIFPDAEEVINRKAARNSKYVASTDMSDMFFAILVAPQSRGHTTFSREGTQYQSHDCLQDATVDQLQLTHC